MYKRSFVQEKKYSFLFGKEQNQLYQEVLLVSEAYQRFQTDVLLSADEVGMHRYQVRISAVNGEENTNNNSEDFFVEILESRQKIFTY